MAETFSTKGTGISNVTAIVHKDCGYPYAACNYEDALNHPNPVTLLNTGTSTVIVGSIITIPGAYVAYSVQTEANDTITVHQEYGHGTGTYVGSLTPGGTLEPIIGGGVEILVFQVDTVTPLVPGKPDGRFQIGFEVVEGSGVGSGSGSGTGSGGGGTPPPYSTGAEAAPLAFVNCFGDQNRYPYTSGEVMGEFSQTVTQSDIWKSCQLDITIPENVFSVVLEAIGYTCEERPGEWQYIDTNIEQTIENSNYPSGNLITFNFTLTMTSYNDGMFDGEGTDVIDSVAVFFRYNY